MSTPTEGKKAPVIGAPPDQNGDQVKLASFAGRRVSCYFYRRADTPGCTTQACGLRDIAERGRRHRDHRDRPRHAPPAAKFDDKYGLGFTLAVRRGPRSPRYGGVGRERMYGKKYMGIIRSAFLVDEKGKVGHAWPKISPKDTPTNLFAALAGG